MAAVEDAREVLNSLQAALVQASGRISELGMRVKELGLDLKTVFERKASGELDLKLVKLGGGASVEKASVISMTMAPTDLVSASQIDDELSEALTVIEASDPPRRRRVRPSEPRDRQSGARSAAAAAIAERPRLLRSSGRGSLGPRRDSGPLHRVDVGGIPRRLALRPG
jgi:hypothetical protein